MTQGNGLDAVRAGGDDVDRGLDLLLQEADIGAGVLRELVQAGQAHGALAPARQLHVNRLDLGKAFAADRRTGQLPVGCFIAHTDFHRLQAIKHIQLGQADAGYAVDLNGMAQRYRVEPATAAGTTGGGADLVALDRQVFTHAVKQLGGERAGTHPGGVGLGNTQNVVQVQGAETRAGSGTAGGGVGRGHVRVGTQVDIQQGALGALEQDVLTTLAEIVQDIGDIGCHGADFFRHLFQLGQRLVDVFGLFLEIVRQHKVVVVHDFTQLGLELRQVEEVRHPQTPAGDLVLIGGTDTPAGGTNLVVAPGFFTGLVDAHMSPQDDRAGQADFQAVANPDAVFLEPAYFPEQCLRRQNHSITDQALDIFAQDTGGDQVQSGFPAVDYQGMARIVPPLKPHNGRDLIGQQINDLALALITPLGAQHNYIFTHDSLSHQAARRRIPGKFTRKFQKAAGCGSTQCFQNPLAVALDQLPVTAPGGRIGGYVIGQRPNNRVGGAQIDNGLLQRSIRLSRSPDSTGALGQAVTQSHQGPDIQAEPGGRTATAKVAADGIVAPALGNRVAMAGYISRKNQAGVVVITTKLTKIEAKAHFRVIPLQCLSYPGQLAKGVIQCSRGPGQDLPGFVERLGATTHPGQPAQQSAGAAVFAVAQQPFELGHGFAPHGVEYGFFGRFVKTRGRDQAFVD